MNKILILYVFLVLLSFFLGFLLASVGVQQMYIEDYNILAQKCIDWSIQK